MDVERRLRDVPAWRRAFLRAVIPAAAAIVVLGGGALAAVEADIADSFGGGIWWALSLMTTVGFAGATPHTTLGRVISGFIMVAGFIVLAMTTAAIASLFVREDEAPEERREQQAEDEMLSLLRDIDRRLQALEAGDADGRDDAP